MRLGLSMLGESRGARQVQQRRRPESAQTVHWESAQSLPPCPTLCDSMDHSLPGSSVHGIFQARVLEWVPLPSLRQATLILKLQTGTSLVVQWLRICLPRQGTWVRSLVQEDSTCCGATKPTLSKASVPHQEKPPQGEASLAATRASRAQQ